MEDAQQSKALALKEIARGVHDELQVEGKRISN
jgi:hypothetical protein